MKQARYFGTLCLGELFTDFSIFKLREQLNLLTVQLIQFLQDQKYEILLFGLLQHLFAGIVLQDLLFYTNTVWEINMLILGLTCIGVFIGKGTWKNYIRFAIFSLVLALPIMLSLGIRLPRELEIVGIVYFIFFALLFWEVLIFLIKPSYINSDIISAALCGYLLLIELCVFLMLFLFQLDATSISNIDSTNPATAFIDLVYFSTIVQTTIGFGDIAPTTHTTKLGTALFGIIGQFYTVVLIGLLLSKFTAESGNGSRN